MTHDARSTTYGRQADAPDRGYPDPVVWGGLIDSRFTDGLVTEVAEVLAARGYPTIDANGDDYEELACMLWDFIYGGRTR